MTVSLIRSSHSALRCVAVVALMCGMSACALIRHDSKPVSTLDAERIRVANDIHLVSDAWPSARWWTGYGDPQLNALVERALADSPTMAIARTRVSQAKSGVDLARAGSNLQVTAIGAVDRQRVSSNGFLSAYSGNQPLLGATGPWYTAGIVGLGASLDVDIWGKQRAQVAAALGVQNARRVETSAVELEISADVAQLYYGIQTTSALIDLQEQLQDVADFSLNAHAARASRGLEAQTPTELARAQKLAAQRQIVAAQGRIRRMRESLRALIGAGPGDLGEIKSVALPTPPSSLPTTLSYELLARRPDLQAMRWYVEASFDKIDAAKAAFYPSFDIKAFFGVNALHLSDLFTHASQQINLVPGLYLPIFDGGLLNANLSGARAASNLLILQYNQSVLNAVRDVAMTGSQLQDLDAEAKLQTQKIQAVTFAERGADAHYRTGLESQLSAVEAKQAVIVERIALLDIDGQRIGQDIALTKALGGGYRAEAPVVLKPR
ncbi:MdtP family multidrug efflux transporter outer membrane subunit [Paraburkholderia sp. EG287A]|uniref:MdtP family multidrug efflux transporter outer membrane subunit n=1 Tax=unclassified Paraburkholderia TaxID=2615204 RepID=UPI0034D2404C